MVLTSPAEGESAADVVVVGYGPVGQLLSVLLAQRGWRVVVLERWPEPFSLPRAVGFDSEAARLLAAAGIGDAFAEFGEPSREYAWRNARGQTLIEFDVAERGHCAWPDSTSFYQPALEAALIARGASMPNLRVLRGHTLVDTAERDDGVDLTAETSGGARRSFRASWVIGCDGANSFVRDRIGTTSTDLGFAHDWLICDVTLREPREFRPNNLQICDPARPRTAVSAGPGHRRWEFMRLPGERVSGFGDAGNAWRLLRLVDVTPENARLDRHAVYTFRASWADHWQSGRLLIAGDAAHLMPPFAGQGMCSGFRDAANLAWKLDFVLAGVADAALLDTYTAERRAHVRHAVTMSVELGKVVCVVNPAAAADRDGAMLTARSRNIGPPARERTAVKALVTGFLHHGADGLPAAHAGDSTPQARVAAGGRTGLFDEIVGLGFVLISTLDVASVPDAGSLAAIGARPVRVRPAGTAAGDLAEHDVVDVDDVYLPYLAGLGAVAALVRPDFYLFGVAEDEDGLRRLVRDAAGRLTASRAPTGRIPAEPVPPGAR
ncbi:bifunctional 3-(3-hydroxy-phenyl)propionate/3-hydroxycinnamic acid hydroxylase [Amycolatopsis sp. WQ 127309]|uniref:bifunctional 3-(3-hydroxy-phenyl)propionate/3-hydroxycinnamic acid hydroxylase MhpA n=1 Tax=Amycolatopsis sp. WQ 127309 TaxID=2932773 RepID=UPI001FF39151|nr:bifunctional 3-(3-hydroxy-phenyl)propionate/3-hydroxycinnamic acid hydroxylase [Amycolatopsis sp. WQ 127309]UOZ02747.1 bifunctional 3-(3-hydroxy-phenyl)propionate/3-hydroxycinnamic acid hydroxylase [Amycolatopsis sp. WQ 127309]